MNAKFASAESTFLDLANMKEVVTFPDWYLFFLTFLLLFVIGAAIVYATWKGVKFFVDPSADMLFAGTNLTLKKLIGVKGLRIYWYFVGGCVLIAGLAGMMVGFVDSFVWLLS